MPCTAGFNWVRSKRKPRLGFELPYQWEIHHRRIGQDDVSADDRLPCYIHALPVELLVHIFELCLTRGGVSPHSFHPHLSKITYEEAPLNLLTICRLWRSVAFETPTLWDAVCPSHNSVAFMKTWLRIAPKLLFHLKIIVDPYFPLSYHSYEHENKMLQLFSTASHRWKSLELEFVLNALHFQDHLSKFLRKATQSLSVPLHLLVRIQRGGYSREIEEMFLALPCTTSIERFSWKHCSYLPREFRPSFYRLPGKGIKILEILHPATTAEFVGYLMQCEAATTVKFVRPDRKHKPLDVPSGLPLRHECLTSLSLSSRTNPMAILERFTFPSLRKLCIGMYNRDRFVFSDFLTRTSGLENLLVHESDVDDYSLRYYLTSTAMRGVPNVRVTFKHASKRGVRIVKENLQMFSSLPALACWKQPYDDDPERLHNNNTKLAVFVGWGEGPTPSRRIWSFHHSALEFRTKTVLLRMTFLDLDLQSDQ